MNNFLTLEAICYECYTKSQNDFKTMNIYAKNLNLSISKFLLFVSNYIENNLNIPEYVKLINVLSKLKNDDQVIEFFKISKANYKYLNDNLLAYYMYYKPNIYYLQKDEISRLRKMLTKYENYLYRNSNPIRNNIKAEDEYAISIIKEFINSKYSKKRFCFNNNISYLNFKSYVITTKKYNKELYDEYLTNLELKEQNKSMTISSDVVAILEKIKEDFNNFNLLDLCLMTNYSINELVEEADKILEMNDKKLFRLKVHSFNVKDILHDERLTRLFKTDFHFNIDNEIFDINDEDKYVIINYLNYNNIPICNETFREGCIKLIKSKQKNIVKTK